MKEHNTIKNIQELTTIFRESDSSLVKGIRVCLEKKDVEPTSVIIVEWFPDDVDFEYGIIIDSNKKIFQFGYNYHEKDEDKGEFSEWLDITLNRKDIPLNQSLDIALKNFEKFT